jgi:hypothetical protein
MAAVTVFVDDAVIGRFPEVCAKTGEPSNGWMRVDARISRRFLKRDKLVIRLPWTEGERLRGLRVSLDASGRWVAIDGVHPDFAAAVRAQNEAATRPADR